MIPRRKIPGVPIPTPARWSADRSLGGQRDQFLRHQPHGRAGRAAVELPDLAVHLGLTDVEIRNDIAGTAIADGTSAKAVRAAAGGRGLTILSINALHPFNVWTPSLGERARRLVAYAEACGARAIVMCPLNDGSHAAADAERLDSLRDSLSKLAPLLREAGIVGLVEPLGFAECSLGSKREAVETIEAVGGRDAFSWCRTRSTTS